MKQNIILALLCIGVLFFNSCSKSLVGTGPSVTKTYNASDFSSISLAIDADVNYILDTVYSIEISAQENVHDLMKVETKESNLTIGFKNFSNLIKHDPIKITVHSPFLSGVEISGSGDLHAIGMFECSSFNGNVSGSGSFSLDYLKSNDIDLNVSGSGAITLNGGESTNFDTHISGSGKIETFLHKSASATTHTSGSGKTKLWAELVLNATISGSGDVYYKGSPSIYSQISGSGKLIKL